MQTLTVGFFPNSEGHSLCVFYQLTASSIYVVYQLNALKLSVFKLYSNEYIGHKWVKDYMSVNPMIYFLSKTFDFIFNLCKRIYLDHQSGICAKLQNSRNIKIFFLRKLWLTYFLKIIDSITLNYWKIYLKSKWLLIS